MQIAKIDLFFTAEYFNQTCLATVPEGWTAEVTNIPQPRHGMSMCYVYGDTREDALHEIQHQALQMFPEIQEFQINDMGGDQ